MSRFLLPVACSSFYFQWWGCSSRMLITPPLSITSLVASASTILESHIPIGQKRLTHCSHIIMKHDPNPWHSCVVHAASSTLKFQTCEGKFFSLFELLQISVILLTIFLIYPNMKCLYDVHLFLLPTLTTSTSVIATEGFSWLFDLIISVSAVPKIFLWDWYWILMGY